MPFRPYFDELITLTGAAPETIAAMFEDLRKYKCHVHGMTQLLSRLPTPVRLSLGAGTKCDAVNVTQPEGRLFLQ